MLKLLKKYKYKILLLSLFLVADVVILPKQERYYFDDDITGFKTVSFYILLFVLESIILIALAIVAIKSFRALEDYVRGLFVVIYAMAVTFFAVLMLHAMFLCVALYLNRQISGGEANRKFIVESKEMKKGNKCTVYLFDVTSNKSSTVYLELAKSQYDGINQSDKVKLTFKKGWFGLVYSPRYAGRLK